MDIATKSYAAGASSGTGAWLECFIVLNGAKQSQLFESPGFAGAFGEYAFCFFIVDAVTRFFVLFGVGRQFAQRIRHRMYVVIP